MDCLIQLLRIREKSTQTGLVGACEQACRVERGATESILSARQHYSILFSRFDLIYFSLLFS